MLIMSSAELLLFQSSVYITLDIVCFCDHDVYLSSPWLFNYHFTRSSTVTLEVLNVFKILQFEGKPQRYRPLQDISGPLLRLLYLSGMSSFSEEVRKLCTA